MSAFDLAERTRTMLYVENFRNARRQVRWEPERWKGCQLSVWRSALRDERAGGGIPDMVKKWMSAGHERHVLSERVNPERSSIFLPFQKGAEPAISSVISSSNEEIKLGVDQMSVLDVLRSNPAATYSDIVRRTVFSESKAYRISCALREKGVIERVGSRKTGSWVVLGKHAS